ncbi:chorismate synthase [Clostridium butyricum]|jgi:chorismate synthase|uniref:chorismate synthase n=1 Tax=Clostridium butyricum TaxID=1492 RepID=UPI0003D616F8|nr:chorismate synthase [Clostridium butyricum]ETI88224.1 MAG: Chorismate synthase [Clostridium butyricum DORA_1]MDU1508277.1 chorismate synthase [Clostridium butyricum]MDU4800191.1 chorismate synthase [Clostridium butyricum]MDU5722346.1 chorismate synthase [Clostridium butyricum]MDU5820594.1 chorismate synthase [Clostridium butyricum]
MSGMWGNKLKVSIFGESHGAGIGITIDGLPSGIEIDMEEVLKEMARRAPGKSKLSTARKEGDQPEILSGFFEGKTTGTPLCAVIRNSDQHSKDYGKLKDLMRPGHADYPGFIRYNGFNDYRGGGHFSGRITAPLVFAGAVCKQILNIKGINVGAHVKSIGTIYDKSFDEVELTKELLDNLKINELPLLCSEKEEMMRNAILEARSDCDSVGGTIECTVIGIDAGVGNPFFDSVESTLAHLMFSVPAVKGIEFGKGFEMSELRGSQCNDEYYYDGDKVKTYTNNNGGITGGITNGMPILFKVGIKPTPSIAKKQRTIDIAENKESELIIEGRHDPCIVQRAVPVIEAVTAIGILDLVL